MLVHQRVPNKCFYLHRFWTTPLMVGTCCNNPNVCSPAWQHGSKFASPRPPCRTWQNRWCPIWILYGFSENPIPDPQALRIPSACVQPGEGGERLLRWQGPRLVLVSGQFHKSIHVHPRKFFGAQNPLPFSPRCSLSNSTAGWGRAHRL